MLKRNVRLYLFYCRRSRTSHFGMLAALCNNLHTYLKYYRRRFGARSLSATRLHLLENLMLITQPRNEDIFGANIKSPRIANVWASASRMERKLSVGGRGFYSYCIFHKEETCRVKKYCLSFVNLKWVQPKFFFTPSGWSEASIFKKVAM